MSSSPVVLAQAAIIKYYRLDGLLNRQLLLTVLEAGKSKIKVSAGTDFVQGPLPGLQAATIQLCAHMTSLCEQRREKALVPFFLSF